MMKRERSRRFGLTLTVVLGVATSGCRRDRAVADGASAADVSTGTTVALAGRSRSSAKDVVDAQPARPDPCSFVPLEDATRLFGPLSGAPYRAATAENTTPTADGRACVYPLVARQNVAENSVIALELKPSGALGFETGVSVAAGAASGFLRQLGIDNADGARRHIDGWDYIGGFTDIMTARTGHLAIGAKWTRARGAADSLLEVMAIMRDHIPDRPFLSDEKGSSMDDRDPCSLLTRDEVERVVGKLVVPPYRSRDLTGLADREGNGCSYYTSGHHVLSIQPTWEHGKQLFRVTTGFNQGVQSKLGGKGDGTDTLEGVWDQVSANMADNLCFLKGDRMLAVSYRTSRTDRTGALTLAALAVKRLTTSP